MLRIHRMLSGVIFGAICLIFVSGCWFNRSELEQRKALSRQVHKLFWKEKFEALDELANELRSTKARFPGGAWKLPWVYEGTMPPTAPCPDWGGALDRVDRWRAKFPNSITARMAHAWINVQLAYGYSQGASGNSLPIEVRQEFFSRLATAQRILDEARQAGALCPEFFHEYLWIGFAHQWDEQHLRELFREAVAFEPQYYDYYADFAQWCCCLPSAGKKTETWQQFINRETTALPKDDGAMIYTYVVWVCCDQFGASIVDDEISWPKMRYGLDVMEKRYPGSTRVRNVCCRFAYDVQDKAAARRMLSLPDFKYDADIWRNDRDSFKRTVEWAMSGPIENVVEEYRPEPPEPVVAEPAAAVSEAAAAVTAATEEAESPAPVEPDGAVANPSTGEASPEDWHKALAEVKTTGVMKQRGQYVAFVNGQIVRPGDIVPIRLGGRVFQFVVKEITAQDCNFEPAGLAKGGTL